MAHLMLEPLDFVLETQLLAFQLGDLEIVGRRPAHLFLDFPIQLTMLFRLLHKMCVERHIQTSDSVGPGLVIVTNRRRFV